MQLDSNWASSRSVMAKVNTWIGKKGIVLCFFFIKKCVLASGEKRENCRLRENVGFFGQRVDTL